MLEIKAPNQYPLDKYKIFLAGSIEMGTAENWQTKIVKEFEEFDITILNPRRDDWDWTWEQKIDNPKFNEQVTWELTALERADLIILHFDPNTKSPISLLEFGLYADTGKMIVYCPEGFWRKGNVDIVCKRYDTTQVNSLPELIEEVKRIIPKR